jgi:hypothetical protein
MKSNSIAQPGNLSNVSTTAMTKAMTNRIRNSPSSSNQLSVHCIKKITSNTKYRNNPNITPHFWPVVSFGFVSLKRRIKKLIKKVAADMMRETISPASNHRKPAILTNSEVLEISCGALHLRT